MSSRTATLTGLGAIALWSLLALARPTAAAMALGLYGLFGDTALYFAALKFAPPAEANLVHYLWPLLIVLFSSFLPGGRLQPRHLAGAVMGLAATALLVGGRFGGGGESAALGFLFAAL